MRMVVIVVGLNLNSTRRLMFCVGVGNEEVRVNLAELAIMRLVGMDVLKRRKQESQQEGEAGLYGDRTSHSLKVYKTRTSWPLRSGTSESRESGEPRPDEIRAHEASVV
jgi:hypothetical protein